MEYNVIWYNGNNFVNNIDVSMLVNNGGKKVISKSHPYINIGAGFDCETSQFDNHKQYEQGSQEYKNALHSFVYIWQFSVGENIYLCRDVNLFEQFLYDLDNACEVHPNAKLIVWDANIKYEYSYFKHIFKKYITKIFAKSKTDIITFDCFKHLQFRECLGVFGKSLAEVAKNNTTTQKLVDDLDYDLIRTPTTPLTDEELQYCINDVAILSELTEVAMNEYILKGDKIPLTQTGIVRNAIKKAMCPTKGISNKLIEQNKPLIGDRDTYNNFRKYAYSGGVTHSNFKYVGVKLNNVKCYDLTSAYTYALSCKNYPSGDMVTVTDPEQFKFALSHKHWVIKITLTHLKSKSTHSTISIHKVINLENPVIDNGRIYECKSVTLYATEIDYSNIKAIYDFDKSTSKIHEVTYFTKSVKIPSAMKNVMLDWYKKKQILKPHSNDNPENKKQYGKLKQFVNCVYGMTCTSLYEENWVWDNMVQEIAMEKQDWDDTSETIFNPWFGYYCTAYVRQRLIECISQFPDYIVQYDTDSIYCLPCDELDNLVQNINARVYAECVKNIEFPECWDLGQWDDDGYYTQFECLGSKRYIGTKPDGHYKITFAGANAHDIISEADKNNIDIYEYIKHIDISEIDSEKTGAFHFDDTYSSLVTDYQGNTEYCTTYGGTTVKQVQFKANLSTMFEELRYNYCKGE